MDEYIRREDAIKCIEGQCIDGKMWGNDESEGTLIEAYSAIDDLMEIPPADVAPVRHGRWHDVYMSGPSSFTGTCSACGVSNDIPYPTNAHYCPNCGAMMDGGDK